LIEFLVSFHVLGRECRGVIICTACAYHKDEAQIQDLQPLWNTPFQITEFDNPDELLNRFGEWLENILTAGLKYWYDSL